MEGTAGIYQAMDFTSLKDSFGAFQEMLRQLPSAQNPTWGSIADTLIEMGRTLSTSWVKGEFFTQQGMCMFGAYLYGGGFKRQRHTRESYIIGSLLADVIRREIRTCLVPEMFMSWNVVVWFNDARHTNLGDVLHVIGQAAKIAQGMEDAGAPLIVTSPQETASLPGDSTSSGLPGFVIEVQNVKFESPALVLAGV